MSIAGIEPRLSIKGNQKKSATNHCATMFVHVIETRTDIETVDYLCVH